MGVLWLVLVLLCSVAPNFVGFLFGPCFVVLRCSYFCVGFVWSLFCYAPRGVFLNEIQ